MTTAGKRPSLAVMLAGAALVAALAALVLSLTGVATGLPGKNRIDGNDLKPNVVGFKNMRNNAIGTAEVRLNALRGADINESSLGKVPSAGNADTVGGASVFQVALSMADDGAPQQVDVGAFKVNMTCNSGDLTVTADSDIPDAAGFSGRAYADVTNELSALYDDYSDDFTLADDPQVDLHDPFPATRGTGSLVVVSRSPDMQGVETYTLVFHYQDANGCSIYGNGLIS